MLLVRTLMMFGMYIQSEWTHNITEGVFTDPPVSHCGTIMYMVAFILLSLRL